ncbi:MAG: Hpt domain-containing protein [Defluviitaleaceae bacterium]|nr:Hpt domain-containing protein [Defluviitaleaceae bacterium]
MNGMEATEIIRNMGYKRPIVALTANALVGQAEALMHNGFDGFLSKPIQTVHLNAVLHKFINAREITAQHNMDEYFDSFMAESGIHDKLCRDFAQKHTDAVDKIVAAIQANDLTTAHRRAHTLKGLAGLISETKLSSLAQEAENMLAEGKVVEDIFIALDDELGHVIDKIKVQYPTLNDESLVIDFDIIQASNIFDNLKNMLETKNANALDMIDDLKKIPHTAKLINHINNVDFVDALKELALLRHGLEI